MKLRIGTKQILKTLTFISGVTFIGLCVQAGEIIFNTIYTLFINPANAKSFWGLNFSMLYAYEMSHFLMISAYMIITSSMKAVVFFMIFKVSQENKLDLKQPFNNSLLHLISNVSYLAIGIGVFSFTGVKYVAWLIAKGIEMPDIYSLKLGGADVWLFMGLALLVIAQIFKRGIEIQDEHELTV